MDYEILLEEMKNKGIDFTLFTEDMYEEKIEDSKDHYDVSDCVLVRTTDVFPYDKKVETPIHGNAYGFGDSEIFQEAIRNVFRKEWESKYSNVEDYMERIEKISEEDRKCQVVFETCRTTTHFTINGLVGSHSYGDFTNRSYIICDSLKKHIDDSNLVGMRPEDTYFNDDISLSEEAAILLPVSSLNEVLRDKEKIETLKNFQVFLFDGNEEHAVEFMLSKLGYDSFKVNEHGYRDGIYDDSNAHKMYDFVYQLAKEKNISVERHFDSDINNQDRIEREERGKMYDCAHFQYLLQHTNLDPKLKDELQEYYNQGTIFKQYDFVQEKIEEMLQTIGFEQFVTLTQEFNERCIANLSVRSKVESFQKEKTEELQQDIHNSQLMQQSSIVDMEQKNSTL